MHLHGSSQLRILASQLTHVLIKHVKTLRLALVISKGKKDSRTKEQSQLKLSWLTLCLLLVKLLYLREDSTLINQLPH